MYKLRNQEIWSSDIANYLNKKLYGKNIIISSPRSISAYADNTPISKRQDKYLSMYIISEKASPPKDAKCYIISEKPLNDLASILLEYFSSPIPREINHLTQISKESEIGIDVAIGPYCYIGPGVRIGDRVTILGSVVINGPVTVGDDSVIKDGAILGSQGYEFAEDGRGNLVHIPQLGKIKIGNNVWIGSNSTIERATIQDTIIDDGTKIDDLVHIGGGTIVGKQSKITAGSVIAYNVTIGDRVVISPNVTVRENVCIKNDIIIGHGAVVTRDLSKKGSYIGTPARIMNKQKGVR